MLGSYPSLNLHDPEIYIAELVALFVRYPEWAGEQAVKAAKRESPTFIPSVPKVEEHCEAAVGPMRRAMEWEANSRQQIADRKLIAHHQPSLEERRATVDRIADELAQHGIRLFKGQRRQRATAAEIEAFKHKFGVTEAEWDALPNAPKHEGYWQGVRVPEDLLPKERPAEAAE